MSFRWKNFKLLILLQALTGISTPSVTVPPGNRYWCFQYTKRPILNDDLSAFGSRLFVDVEKPTLPYYYCLKRTRSFMVKAISCKMLNHFVSFFGYYLRIMA